MSLCWSKVCFGVNAAMDAQADFSLLTSAWSLLPLRLSVHSLPLFIRCPFIAVAYHNVQPFVFILSTYPSPSLLFNPFPPLPSQPPPHFTPPLPSPFHPSPPLPSLLCRATLAVQQAIQDLDPQEKATSVTPRTPSGITMATTPLSTPTSAEPEPPSSSELPANMVEDMRLAMEQSVLAETPLPPGADFSPVIPQLTRACVEELKEGLRRSKKVKCPNEVCVCMRACVRVCVRACVRACKVCL